MEIPRTVVILGAATLLVLLLVIVLLFIVLRTEREDAPGPAQPEYFDRDLMIDDIEFEMPDPAARLLEPQIEYVVDPDKPFPTDIARQLEEDTLSSLEESLRLQLEIEIERLIRDE